MVTSFLPLLSFLQAKNKKKWATNNKLVVITLFVAKTIKEKKCDGSKLVVNAHVCLK
jgi:hypothetical protein